MEDSERECRVCREGETDEHPLYAPCMCSGSILYCHQDCLEEWLSHSGKDYCELCKTKYVFAPVYAENTPDIIPFRLIVSSLFYSSYVRVLPVLFRGCVAITCWLIIVPLSTSFIYRFFMYRDRVPFLYSWEVVWNDIVSGITATGLIGLSCLLVVRLIQQHGTHSK
jgi:E3 ubiquitin-protein ligase MARCH6